MLLSNGLRLKITFCKIYVIFLQESNSFVLKMPLKCAAEYNDSEQTAKIEVLLTHLFPIHSFYIP